MKARFKDCGLAYILCFVFVLGVGIVLSNIINVVALNEGIDVSEVVKRPWTSYLSAILSELAFVLAFFVIVLVSKNKDFKSAYKLNCKFDYKILLISIFLGVFVMFCSLNLTNAINIGFSYFSSLELTNYIGFPLQTFGQFLLAVFVLAVLPAVCEELLFRGIIFNGLRQRFSRISSIILSSLMFMLIHMSIYKSFYQIILGVICAILVSYTGTIVYSIIFHFINNFTIVAVSYVLQGKTMFEFSAFGVREVLISILIFIVAVYVTIFVLKYLKSYANSHKKYFNLEATNAPLSQNMNQENITYEQKLLYANKANEGVALLFVSISFALILWSFSSFGGFI